MNYATLATYQLLRDSDPQILVQYLKKQVADFRKSGLSSASYYFNQNQHQLRILSVWLEKTHYQNNQKSYLPRQLNMPNGQANIVGLSAFQMLWEMQRSHLQNSFSNLIEIYVPDRTGLQPILTKLRKVAREQLFTRPEVVGIWVGSDQNDPQRYLGRVDWLSRLDFNNYRAEGVFQIYLEELSTYGAEIAYLSDELVDDFISGGGYIKAISEMQSGE